MYCRKMDSFCGSFCFIKFILNGGYPVITEHTLSNGIRLVIEQQPHFRSVSLGIWVKVGSAYEKKENQGISHLIEHMLFKGTKNRSAKDISGLIARIGDDVNAYTSNEYTCYYGSTLPEFLPELAGLFSDMLTDSVFAEEELIKEKSVVMDEIDMYNDSPEDLVHEKLQEAVWQGHPLSYLISGDKTSVENISRAELVSFYREYYTGSNMILSLAGNAGLSCDEIVDLFEGLFSKIPTGDVHDHELTKPAYQATTLQIDKKIEQLHINMAFEAISALSSERYIAGVFNAAFGGSDNSLLFQNIREEQGLAYSVYSYQNNYLKSGLFHVDITVNPKQAAKVVESVVKMMEQVKKTEFTDEVLDVYKNQIKIDLIMRSEGAKSKMSKNAKDLLYFGTLIPLEEMIQGILSVTGYEVREFAKKYLDIKNASLCIVGKPMKKDIKYIDLLLEA